MIPWLVGGGIGIVVGWNAHKGYMTTLWDTSRKLKSKLSYRRKR
jgi:hypothetical protein